MTVRTKNAEPPAQMAKAISHAAMAAMEVDGADNRRAAAALYAARRECRRAIASGIEWRARRKCRIRVGGAARNTASISKSEEIRIAVNGH